MGTRGKEQSHRESVWPSERNSRSTKECDAQRLGNQICAGTRQGVTKLVRKGGDRHSTCCPQGTSSSGEGGNSRDAHCPRRGTQEWNDGYVATRSLGMWANKGSPRRCYSRGRRRGTQRNTTEGAANEKEGVDEKRREVDGNSLESLQWMEDSAEIGV